MKTLKTFLTEATSIPTAPSASKISNYLKKNFGFVKNKSWSGDSNPYSTDQKFTGKIPQENISSLISTLKKENWKDMSDLTTKGHKRFHSKEGAAIVVHLTDGYVSIIGQKKAKTSSMPYYD